MKRMLSLFVVMSVLLCLCSCGSDPVPSPTPEPSPEVHTLLSSGNISIDGICTLDSYVSDDGSPLKPVFFFYTIWSEDENLSITSEGTTLTINGKNSYESKSLIVSDYITKYYNSTLLKQVYMGEELCVVTTFMIPEADLAAGRSITIKDERIPGAENLRFNTDDIQHFNDILEIAQAMDPQGYAEQVAAETLADMQEAYLREPVDEETENKAKSCLIGDFCWSFVCLNMSCEIEFFWDNTYELRAPINTTSGTYEITNGYIICTNADTGSITEIPWHFTDNDIAIDPVSAFGIQ